MTTISARDRMFLAFDTARTRQHVGFVATFDVPREAGPGHLDRTLRRLRAARTVVPPFSFRLPRPRRRGLFLTRAWEVVPDGGIDLHHHVRCRMLPEPGGAEELAHAVSRLHSTPLDPARPLWELHLLGGLEGSGGQRFALYFKFHHALLDGVGCMRRLPYMLGEDPADDTLRPLWGVSPPAPADATDAPPPDGSPGRPRPRHVMPFAATRSVLNGRIGPSRAVAMSSYALGSLRTVAKATETTVNDVLLAVCGSALRSYLDERGRLPRRSLSALVPLSVRGQGDLQGSNVFSLMVTDLATDVPDPLERLRGIGRATACAKAGLRGLPRAAAERYGASVTVPFVLQHLVGLAGRTPPPYNVVVSNVPGRQEPRFFLGARLEALYPLESLSHGTALSMAACSYDARLHFAVTADRDAFPDLGRLRQRTDEALDELHSRTG